MTPIPLVKPTVTGKGMNFRNAPIRASPIPINNAPATPRWEWFPGEVAVEQPLASYFDYLLVRGGNDRPPAVGFHLAWMGNRWAVFERDETSLAGQGNER